MTTERKEGSNSLLRLLLLSLPLITQRPRESSSSRFFPSFVLKPFFTMKKSISVRQEEKLCLRLEMNGSELPRHETEEDKGTHVKIC